jgi:sarcosine oxidase delta subunit
VAQCQHFCNLISLFSLISNDHESYQNLWDELYGCNNYLKIPFDTLMDMPVHIRKYWIHKYNAENKEDTSTPNTSTISGMNLNTYASLEQMKLKNSK